MTRCLNTIDIMNVYDRYKSFPSGARFLATCCLLARAMVGRAFDRGLYDLGTSAYLQATFHGLDRLAFLELQHTLLSRIAHAAVGAGDSIVFRDMDTSQVNGPLGYEARLLFDFSPADATPASLIASVLANNPETVIPTDVFGQFSVSHATILQCPEPCGDHGLRAPEIAAGSGAVSCTCQCDPGWQTNMNQPFETFVYCSVPASTTTDSPLTTPTTSTTPSTPGTPDTPDTPDTSTTAPTTPITTNTSIGWRPPVPSYPPPPPTTKTTKTSVPLFKWIIIGASIVVIAILLFVLCRTRCCGLWGLCCGDGCCTRSSASYKYPVAPQRIHVHAMHQPPPVQYAYMTPAPPAPQSRAYPPQYFAPPPPESYHTPPPPAQASMAPLGHGFRPPQE